MKLGMGWIPHKSQKLFTSVCRMAALCSLAVRDSFSTSMCCLLSENWFVRVSSLVCKASSSVSFLDNSCFTWPIWKRKHNTVRKKEITQLPHNWTSGRFTTQDRKLNATLTWQEWGCALVVKHLSSNPEF